MTRNTNLNVSRERVSAYKEVKGTPNMKSKIGGERDRSGETESVEEITSSSQN